MKVQLFLFPDYVTVASAMGFSPNLEDYLRERGVEFEPVRWDGTCDDIPWDASQPFMVRVSTEMQGAMVLSAAGSASAWREVARRCQEHGHFCFYNDRLVRENGELVSEGLLEEAEKFLARLG